MKTRALCVTLVLAAAACRDVPAPTETLTPSLAITDGAHNGGNAHFYWLPPLVSAPSPAGTFDPSSSPVVRIAEWAGGEGALMAEFSMSSGSGSERVRVDVDAEQYIVNWHTGRFALDPRINYRIRVLVGGAELGSADVDVVASGRELKAVDANYIALLNGRTLPIKFRIEEGAVVVGAHLTLVKHVVNDDGRTAVATDFTLSASGPTSISGLGGVSSAAVPAGTYTLGESGPPGYSASAWTCTGGTLAGSQITLAPGQAAVCEITNDDVPPTTVRLVSDAGDYIGQGRTYEYDQANALITVTASGGHFRIDVRGDERWTGDFQVPNTLSRLEPGSYTGLARYPFHDPAVGGLDWFGEGRGCNTVTGSFIVDRVTYVGNTLTVIALRFEHHCGVATPALRGEIHWSAGDPTLPPNPVYPVPSSLWQPAAGSTPATGNFVYLNSDAGDFIGQGQTYTYTPSNATITVSAVAGRVTVRVTDAQAWTGEFQTMYTLSRLEPGYYPDLRRFPFHNPAKGGLSWSGHGRGCNTLRGWFVVDQVTYTSGVLTALDLRFEQRCEGGATALHGAIHWVQ